MWGLNMSLRVRRTEMTILIMFYLPIKIAQIENKSGQREKEKGRVDGEEQKGRKKKEEETQEQKGEEEEKWDEEGKHEGKEEYEEGQKQEGDKKGNTNF